MEAAPTKRRKLDECHLMRAVQHPNNIANIKLLLDEKADINQSTAEGKTALFCAVVTGCVLNVQYLLERGADLSITIQKEGRYPETPFWAALSYNLPSIARYLIHHTNNKWVSQYRKGDWTGLHHASMRGLFEIVRVLVEDGKVNIDEEDGLGITPLMTAIVSEASSKSEIIKYLVSRGANVPSLDHDLYEDEGIYNAILEGKQAQHQAGINTEITQCFAESRVFPVVALYNIIAAYAVENTLEGYVKHVEMDNID